MNRENASKRSDTNYFLIGEIAVTIFSFFIAYQARLMLQNLTKIVEYNIIPIEDMYWSLLASCILTIFFSSTISWNKHIRQWSGYIISKKLVSWALIEFILLSMLIFLLKKKAYSRSYLVLLITSKYLFIYLYRLILLKAYHFFFQKEMGLSGSILLISKSETIDHLMRNILLTFSESSIRGYLSFVKEKPSNIIKYYGEIDVVDNVLKDVVVDHVVIYCTLEDLVKFKKPIQKLNHFGKRVNYIIKEFNDTNMSKETIGSMNSIVVDKVSENTLYYTFRKIVDLIAGVIGSMIAIMLYFIFYIPIKLQTKESVLFKQERIGKNGRRFYMYKFRSMKNIEVDEDQLDNEARGPVFKMGNDPRITAFGRILRKTSLDEVPQFFNIIKGDMSLIGPRPPVPSEVEKYKSSYYQKLNVKPGITGYWQTFLRDKTYDFDEVLKSDTYYIENRNILLDIEIILRTFYVMLRAKGK